ncbi:MAG: response regulator [Verrucomicrobiota bacterium]|nr:response regulator [Verrucomicrobiota bacterium]
MATILLIDDEEAMRVWMSQYLEHAGYGVVTAEDGEEGSRKASNQRFDLVIVDILMPKKEGLETIADLRAQSQNLPIIAMSGGGVLSSVEVLDIAETFGADATLEKPFTGQTLLERVDQILSRE